MSNTQNRFPFVGEHPCIDFVNTQVTLPKGSCDPLDSFDDLLNWLRDANLLSADELSQALARLPSKVAAERLLKRARHLRAVLYELLNGITQQRRVPDNVIQVINALLHKKTGYSHLVRTGRRYIRQFQHVILRPEQLLIPVAEAAADLIAQGDWSRIKKCENPPCTLYFYDTSKNHTRRWCSMAVCGNRMKAQAHYRRRTETH